MILLLLACSPDPKPAVVSYHQDIAPLLQEHCVSCHSPGKIAPFSLDNYATASAMGAAMLASVEAGTMPPWLARNTEECSPERPFADDLRLSEADVALLRDWVDAGTPEGDAAAATVLPDPPALEVQDPDGSFLFPVEHWVEGEQDEFVCFVIDPGNTEPLWVTEAQLVPSNNRVAHHGLVMMAMQGPSSEWEDPSSFSCFNNPPGTHYLVSTWTPGAVPNRVPEGTGMLMPAGARIVVQMHYHPTGEGPEVDQSTLQLKWTDQQPQWEAAQALVGNYDDLEDDGSGLQPGPNDEVQSPEFRIPAGSSDHVESMLYRQNFPLDFPIYSVGTHMHYVGTDMKIDLVNADGSEECLVQTPAWDFNWQRSYSYDVAIEDLPVISDQEGLKFRCTYDNSMGNPFVVKALAEQGLSEPHDVYLGEQTLDEMCLGIFGILAPPGIFNQLFGG